MDDVCEVIDCERITYLIYSASKSGRKRRVCNHHWNQHSVGNINLKSKRTYKNGKSKV